MKRLFFAALAAALMFSGTAFAQLSVGEGSWTAGGGATFFNLSGSDAGQLEKKGFPGNIPGFYFGASLDYAFSTIEGLSVEPGVYIQHYGKAFKYGEATEKKSYHANYLHVPIDLKFAFPTGGDIGIAVFTGPRFNLGIGGNMFSAAKSYPGLMPIEAMWGLGLAVSLQDAVVIKGGYNNGLTKAIRDNKDLGMEDLITHKNSFYVGIGFAF
ncbi:MAG: outer membrane beta-barrel protein [Bacteroidales bacterium]|nr:outer membrane beta-barrel protein [Bacteroidales bacterium]